MANEERKWHASVQAERWHVVYGGSGLGRADAYENEDSRRIGYAVRLLALRRQVACVSVSHVHRNLLL